MDTVGTYRHQGHTATPRTDTDQGHLLTHTDTRPTPSAPTDTYRHQANTKGTRATYRHQGHTPTPRTDTDNKSTRGTYRHLGHSLTPWVPWTS